MHIIVAPINSLNELETLYDAGAREFYFGYLNEKWVEKYGAFTGNRRENYSANFTDIEKIYGLTNAINALGVPCAMTFNDRYTHRQYDMLEKVLNEVVDAGVKRIIAADVGLIAKVKEWGLKVDIQISTGGGAFNRETVKFYKDMGAKRIILPRQLRISEINSIVQSVPDIEYEVFGMHGRDPYIDAFCRFHHGMNCLVPGLGPCGCVRMNEAGITSGNMDAFRPYRCLNTLYVDGCSACAVRKMNTDIIKYYKIVGRSAKTDRKLKAIKFLRQVFDLLENGDLNNFEEKNRQIFEQVYGEQCSAHNCYYRLED